MRWPALAFLAALVPLAGCTGAGGGPPPPLMGATDPLRAPPNGNPAGFDTPLPVDVQPPADDD